MPLNYLFIDMNSYFASVEQQLLPSLRGRPVAVVPTRADTTCCIAASYEAKRFGIKTGTLVKEAKRLCPELRLLEARPKLYVETHHRIVKAVEACLPVHAVMSIDEMVCRLGDGERDPEPARRLAGQVKASIAGTVGEYLRSSIGLGPNILLAKVAADMQKPDGLTVIRSEDLPQCLYQLHLRDFPGVGPRMERRLNDRGITTVQQLCEMSRPQLAALWDSHVLADRWWRRLRGEDVRDPPTRRHSIGHSHVLAPQLRNDTDAWTVLVSLLHKAAARLRQMNYWTCSLTMSVGYFGRGTWQASQRLSPCRDTLTLLHAIEPMWRDKPRGTPMQVGVVLSDLREERNIPQSLFEEDRRLLALADAMDRVNDRFGPDTVYFGGSHRPVRPSIAFTRIPDV